MSEMKHAGDDLTVEKSVYETLRSINVSDHTEKKNGLTYLSWAWAWDTLMLHFPDSYVNVIRDKNGRFWFDDGFTGWVEVEVIVRGKGFEPIRRSELFPIMDYKNRSIPADQITSFSANTAVQRAITKAIARHGLGLYVYAGEDLPPELSQEKVEDKKAVPAENSRAFAELVNKAKEERDALGELYEQLGQDIDSANTKNYIIAKAKVLSADPETVAKTGDAEALERMVKVFKALRNAAKRKIGEKMITDQSETF